MKRGDIVEFKGSGPVFKVLSWILRRFEKDWDGWGWHLAFITDKVGDRYTIGESVAKGVTEAWLDPKAEFRVYRWFPHEIPRSRIKCFLLDRAYCRYDVTIYFWTIIQYLVRHYLNRPIPRLLDNRFTCWELVFEMCEEMGKPVGSKYDCPLITDFLKVAPPPLHLETSS